MTRPRLAVTLGDVAGIGPETVARALLSHPRMRESCSPVVVGDAASLRRGLAATGLDGEVAVVDSPADVVEDPRVISVIQDGPELDAPWGVLNPIAGDAAARFVMRACRLARDGEIDGIVTAPLNKAAMHAGGHAWPGHTELLAHEFGVDDYSLVLSAGDLYLFHLTTHVSLSQAIQDVTPARTDDVLRLAGGLARALGMPSEPIGLAGLNPHAGEGGIFGSEDASILAPAVARARARGLDVHGPLPGDALMPQAMRGGWKFAVACYHDQGHAPFKAVFGDEGVNITVGLPVVRVSVDHGTAFDIAGRGIAREASLVLALERATALAPRWSEVWTETGRSHSRS